MANKSPDDADGASPGTTCENHHSDQMRQMSGEDGAHSVHISRL